LLLRLQEGAQYIARRNPTFLRQPIVGIGLRLQDLSQ
jgi:hypothetical protein